MPSRRVNRVDKVMESSQGNTGVVLARRRVICYRGTMSAAALRLNGVDLVADLSGALWWPERATLVVADLHLEKGSAFAAQGGALLPPYDTDATLTRLEEVVARLAPARVIALGDSFHDRAAVARVPAASAARLAALVGATAWIWVAGNHDPRPEGPWGGAVRADVTLGALAFRHAAEPDGRGEVSGHFHPKATLHVRGRRLSTRCFVTDGRRLVLPAFGAYAGGLDVFAPPLRALFRDGFEAFLLGNTRVTPVSHRRLQGVPA
jgi:DNA ligase-associated metallophosphoesterase